MVVTKGATSPVTPVNSPQKRGGVPVADRDEVQTVRWQAIRERVGMHLRGLRLQSGATSQARLSIDLEALGYRMTQSMVSRYEQGILDAPLSLERLSGWALCCQGLSAPLFMDLMALAGFHLPWSIGDLQRFDELLVRYRALALPDQVVFRRSLLWHVLGLRVNADIDGNGREPIHPGANTDRQAEGFALKGSG